MSANGLPSEGDAAGASPLPPVPGFVRATSEVRVALARTAGRTGVRTLFETGGLRLKFPHAAGGCEGVLVNTGGGMAGGDRSRLEVGLDPAASAILTTQSAEKVYRSDGGSSCIDVRISLSAGASLSWLPQETILFDGARLERQLEADLEDDASLTLLETIVLGRTARGERVETGLLRDRWRIRRDGRLALAEDIRLDGRIALALANRAVGAGARAVATLVHVARDAERQQAALRPLLAAARSECGMSAWNGLLVARFISPDPAAVRTDATRAALALLRIGAPRVWSC